MTEFDDWTRRCISAGEPPPLEQLRIARLYGDEQLAEQLQLAILERGGDVPRVEVGVRPLPQNVPEYPFAGPLGELWLGTPNSGRPGDDWGCLDEPFDWAGLVGLGAVLAFVATVGVIIGLLIGRA